MKTVSSLMSRMPSMVTVSGECPTHGQRDIAVRREKPDWYCPDCAAERRRQDDLEQHLVKRINHLLRIAAIPERYLHATFSATTPAMKQARGAAKLFIDGVVARKGWQVLTMLGNPGTGKTLLASEIAQALIQNHAISTRYCTAMSMLSEIKASYSDAAKERGISEESEIARFVDFEVLVLDEIDQIRSTESDRLLMQEVINRRYNANRSVIVLSNRPLAELEEVLGERIVDRLCENSVTVAFDWQSFRRAA